MTNSVSPSVDKNVHALDFWKGVTVIVQTQYHFSNYVHNHNYISIIRCNWLYEVNFII